MDMLSCKRERLRGHSRIVIRCYLMLFKPKRVDNSDETVVGVINRIYFEMWIESITTCSGALRESMFVHC